tara:strand:+ start:32 stop:439 length:408 start_codon:yes stop_codon:yes gene_type:complete
MLLIVFTGCKSNKIQNVDINTEKNTFSKVFFKNLNNGDTVQSPVVVEMGVRGMKIKPAGQLEAGTGHHHIIIDGDFMDYGEIIPMDKKHLHYGKGDTVASVPLSSGQHTLTLQFANGLHMSYGEQFSNTISIYVK